MRILRRAAALVAATTACAALGLVSARPAAAWWAPGHAVIAIMAYRQMKPETRAAVDQVLKQHPDYKNWLAELPAGVTDAQRGEDIFAIASTWPDRIKDIRDDTVSVKFFNPGDKRNPPPQPFPSAPGVYPDLNSHDSWHYTDIPIDMDGKVRSIPEEESALTAIPTCRGNAGASYLPGSYRAYYLAWLVHLVGDVHQPLHATGRFTAAEPNGDAGGNGVRFKDASGSTPKNLHSYWDSLLGNGPDPTHYNTLKNYWTEMNATISTIDSESPRLLAGYDPATRDNLDERAWLRESFSASQEFVYTFADPETAASGNASVPDATYHTIAVTIAHQRAALAAHRLALICDAIYAHPAQP